MLHLYRGPLVVLKCLSMTFLLAFSLPLGSLLSVFYIITFQILIDLFLDKKKNKNVICIVRTPERRDGETVSVFGYLLK